jgi:hypothetical protein
MRVYAYPSLVEFVPATQKSRHDNVSETIQGGEGELREKSERPAKLMCLSMKPDLGSLEIAEELVDKVVLYVSALWLCGIINGANMLKASNIGAVQRLTITHPAQETAIMALDSRKSWSTPQSRDFSVVFCGQGPEHPPGQGSPSEAREVENDQFNVSSGR